MSIINLTSKEITKEIPDAHEASLAELKFTIDGSKLISGGYDGKIKIWSLGSLNIQASLAYQKSQASYAQNQKSDQLQNQEDKQYRGDMLKGLGVAYSGNDLQFGNYYALIIGIDNYTGQWRQLKNAVSDAKAVYQILKSKYKFDYLKELYNEQATRVNIIKELNGLYRTSNHLTIF